MRIRNCFLALSTLVLLFGSTPASALDFSLYGSYWDTEALDNATGFGARLGFGRSFQFEIGASYYDELGIDLAIETINTGVEVRSVDTEVIPVDLGVRFNSRDGRWYLAGGGTYYFLDSNLDTVEDDWGLYARLGRQFRSMFLEVGYRDVGGKIDSNRIEIGGAGEVIVIETSVDLAGPFFNLGWTL